MSEENISTKQSSAGEEARVPPAHVDTRWAGNSEGAAHQGPPPARGLIWSIDRRATFESLRHGRRYREGPLSVSWVAGHPTEPPRVAFTIGRRFGTAVARNRIRRRLRALMRDFSPRLRPGAYLVSVSAGAASLSYAGLRETLDRLLTRFEGNE